MRQLSDVPSVLGEVFRVDAMADADGIAIGSWETFVTTKTKKARWSHLRLDRTTAPFLYVKGEPFRTIYPRAGGLNGGPHGLRSFWDLEERSREDCGDWVHRQLVELVPPGQVLDDEIPGVFGAYGVVQTNGQVRLGLESDLDTSRTERRVRRLKQGEVPKVRREEPR